MSGRTFAIGDVHGDLEALDALLDRLPAPDAGDTLVFLGDYVDRGPNSRGVVERVRALERDGPARVVALRGNHEDEWLRCYENPNPGFLLPVTNGCAAMYRSFAGGAPLPDGEALPVEEISRFVNVASWLARDVVDWFTALRLWHEDDHAVYVHAGLEGEGTVWQKPSASSTEALLWMREPDFFAGYHGKRLVFGHTRVEELPLDHLGFVARVFDDPKDVWVRGDLIGIDTGCGKGGFLSAIELPRMRVYESR